MAHVQPACVCRTSKEWIAQVVQSAMHTGEHRAHVRTAAVQLLPGARDQVIGARLDGLTIHPALLASHRLEQPDREPVAEPSTHLACAEYRGGSGAAVVAVAAEQRG